MPEPLDEFMPVYRHRERHQRTITAAPNAVWDALLAVTFRELPLSRFLMGVRSIPRRVLVRHAESDNSQRPVIETFRKSGFRDLRVDPPRLLIAGTAIQPWRLVRGEVGDIHDAAGFRKFSRPGFVLAAISFELEPFDDRTRLATETRVQPTDASAGRAFLPYWLVIRAGSGLIRRETLRAVGERAEAT